MHADKNLPLNEITERILGCAYEVANCLGSGFLEKVYENAVAHELRKAGLRVEQQRTIEVRYDGIIVGSYCADLLVEEAVLVELKGHFTQAWPPVEGAYFYGRCRLLPGERLAPEARLYHASRLSDPEQAQRP